MRRIAVAMALSLALASCSASLGEDAQAKAAKVYDTVCFGEPLVYTVASALADKNGWKQSKVDRLNEAHAVVTRLCTNRPTDLVAGLVTLSAAYRDVLALKASAET